MAVHDYVVYWKAMNVLEAKESMQNITVSTFQNLKEETRRNIFKDCKAIISKYLNKGKSQAALSNKELHDKIMSLMAGG